MNEDTLADLKQSITATVRQELSDVARKSDIVRLDKKIDDTKVEILEAIGETMAANTEATDERLASVDHRVTLLESRAA